MSGILNVLLRKPISAVSELTIKAPAGTEEFEGTTLFVQLLYRTVGLSPSKINGCEPDCCKMPNPSRSWRKGVVA